MSGLYECALNFAIIFITNSHAIDLHFFSFIEYAFGFKIRFFYASFSSKAIKPPRRKGDEFESIPEKEKLYEGKRTIYEK